jgi:hypothetical protein
MMPCPTEDDLVRLHDGALSVEETERLRAHVARCPRCREEDEALRTLIEDLRVPPPGQLDVAAHVQSVMGRLGHSVSVPARAAWAPRLWTYGSVVAAAACVLVAALHLHPTSTPLVDTWQARGGETAATLGRDVGVQPYLVRNGLHPLTSGTTVEVDSPLTAGFRNLGHAPAFLLLFAIDVHGAVHWISPPFERADEDPASTLLDATVQERLLERTTVLEGVPTGPLRVVALLTTKPAHVSDVEQLEGSNLGARALMARLPGSEVRETLVDVHDGTQGSRR